jgi:hypothetical protein
MVLIPPDVGVRMRMQAEASLQAITPAREIPADLPELQTGQAFTARIQEILPENIYRALVAGKSITLSLPQGARAGDTLELVVVDRTPQAIVAQLAPPTTDAAIAEPYSNANLSPAGQMIGKLLLANGEEPVPAALSRGQPVLAQAPQNGAELAPKLSQAVSQSGLFYEAHQAKWIAGQLSLSQLQQEPQGQQAVTRPAAQTVVSPQTALATASALAARETVIQASLSQPLNLPDETYAATRKQAVGGTLPQTPAEAANLPARESAARIGLPATELPNRPIATLQTPFPLRTEGSVATATATIGAPAQQIPDELRPLVQQQLDSVATQRLAWHGEVWPGQKMDWQIEWEKEAARNDADVPADHWSTTLSLTTPRLGKVDAVLKLAGDGIRITLATPYGASAADLRNGSTSLAIALEQAGVRLLGLQVKHEEE